MSSGVQGFVNFNPYKDISSLKGKVIFITGGTAGLGAETVKLLATHNPSHVYFSGRNTRSGQALIDELKTKVPALSVTFVEMDQTSLHSVKDAVEKHFTHDRLDILICNAGIMAHQTAVSKDGYEIQFATNHLGHAMLIRCLLPTLVKTAKQPGSDVRIISLTSLGFFFHPRDGISFKELESGSTMYRLIMGGWLRYGQSKLANILYATALSKHYPSITSVSVHPGVVKTDIVNNQSLANRLFIYLSQWFMGRGLLQPEQGAWNTAWAAAAAKKGELKNGGFYVPVGKDGWNDVLDKTARDGELADRLWGWTEGILEKC